MTHRTSENRFDHWIIVCVLCWTYIILAGLCLLVPAVVTPLVACCLLLLLAILQSHHEDLTVRGNPEGAKGCEDHHQI